MTSMSVSDLYACDRWPHRSPGELLARGAVGASALGGAVAGAHPTGSSWADIVLTAGVAGAVAALGPLAGLPAVFAALVVAAAAGGGSGFALTALAAGVLVVVRLVDGGEVAAYGGVAAAGIAAQGLLRLDDLGGPGRSAVVAAVGVGIVGAAAWPQLGVRERWWAMRVAVVTAGLVVLVTMVAGVALWRASVPLRQGEESARNAIEALRSGDTAAATALLDDARGDLADGQARASTWWAQPARLVPIVGLHVSAVTTVADEAGALVDAAQAVTVALDGGEAVPGGGVDLARIETLRNPLLGAAAAVERAALRVEDVDSPWLASPLSGPLDELSRELHDLLPEARLGTRALDVVPGLLGRDRPQRFLVLFGTPSETREGGGIVANVVEIVATGGQLALERSARNLELNDATTATGLVAPETYPTRFVENEPWLFAQNWTGTPDFPTAARAVTELYPQMGGAPIDAVVYIDPYGLEALLQLTGPVAVPGLPNPLTAETAAPFLLVGQYVEFPELDDRVDFLDGAARAVFDALTTTTDLSDIGHVLDVMNAPVAGRHLMMAAVDTAAQSLLTDAGIAGAFPSAPSTDQLAVVQANASADKLDAFLQRDITYDVVVDPGSGAFDATVTIVLSSTVPPGLPAYVVGEPYAGLPAEAELLILSIYTPSELVDAEIDAVPWSVEQRIEHGQRRLVVPLSVVPGTPVTVRYRIAGQLPNPDGGYALHWVHQPMVNEDRITVTVRSRTGDSIDRVDASGPVVGDDNGTSATFTGTLDRDADLAVTFD